AFGACVRLVGEGQRSAACCCMGDEYGGAFGMRLPDHDRDVLFDDTRFFGRYARDGRAEDVAVVDADVGDDAQRRYDDVRGVEPAAEPRFDDGDFRVRLGEPFESHGGGHFKIGEAEFGHRPAIGGHESGDALLRYLFAVHADAFPEIVQVRRCIEPRAVSGGLQYRGEDMGYGTFAVGTRDVDGHVVALRVSHRAAHC